MLGHLENAWARITKVTFKWLSLTLQVHCNTAKQMLYTFLEAERKKKGKDGLTVTYFVSGISRPDENEEQVFKCAVVPEHKLETYKSSLDTVTSCHVYSIQRVELKNSNSLFMTDYEKFKENVFAVNKFSSIQYSQAVPRSSDDMELLTFTRQSVPEKESAPPATAASKTAGTKKPQSALANMFAKADASKKAADQVKKDESKKAVIKKEVIKKEPETGKVKEDTKKGTKKSPAVTPFFTKQSEKKTPTSSKPETKTKDKSPEKASPAGEKSTTKRATRDEDSEEDVGVRSKKRQRVKRDLLDSSSEEEEEEEEEAMEEGEEPIPPTPPPQAKSPVKEARPPKATEDTVSSKESTVKGGNSGERQRRRRRKQVNKTYMGEDGYMVTEKVWESESTDASEAEEPAPKKEPAKPAATKPATKGKGGKKASPHKKSPDKKNSGKQTSLMSFFKKS